MFAQCLYNYHTTRLSSCAASVSATKPVKRMPAAGVFLLQKSVGFFGSSFVMGLFQVIYGGDVIFLPSVKELW